MAPSQYTSYICTHILTQKPPKESKKEQHMKEKAFMAQLCGAGDSVGEYVGGGKADIEDIAECTFEDCDTDYDHVEGEQIENGDVVVTENAHPLFDIETTGLSIYEDHIIEIVSKIVGIPCSPITCPSFSSLVHTPKNIPPIGKQ